MAEHKHTTARDWRTFGAEELLYYYTTQHSMAECGKVDWQHVVEIKNEFLKRMGGNVSDGKLVFLYIDGNDVVHRTVASTEAQGQATLERLEEEYGRKLTYTKMLQIGEFDTLKGKL